MFYLRRISGNGVQMNQTIGEGYTVVDRAANPEEFRRSFEAYFKKTHVADTDPEANEDTRMVYAFVGNGTFMQPLYKGQKAFIMTGTGSTFANVSFGPQ